MSKHERGDHMPQVVHPDGIGDVSPYTSPLKSLVDTGDRLSLFYFLEYKRLLLYLSLSLSIISVLSIKSIPS